MFEGYARRVENYRNELDQLGRDGFLSLYDHPFLVLLAPIPPLDDGEDSPTTGVAPFKTICETARSGEMRWGLFSRPKAVLGSPAFAVKKRGESPYTGQVSIGRTRASDICLPHRHISKLHAYFTWSHDRAHYFLTDAGATNGTSIEGRLLPPKTPTRVRSGARVDLGPFAAIFCDQESFLDLVRKV